MRRESVRESRFFFSRQRCDQVAQLLIHERRIALDADLGPNHKTQ